MKNEYVKPTEIYSKYNPGGSFLVRCADCRWPVVEIHALNPETAFMEAEAWYLEQKEKGFPLVLCEDCKIERRKEKEREEEMSKRPFQLNNY